MTERLKLVRNDKLVRVVAALRDDKTDDPIDLTGCTCQLTFRQEGESTTMFSVTGSLLAGIEADDGTVDTTAPYDVAGAGGRVAFTFPPGALDGIEAGSYEGEIDVTFPGGANLTAYDVAKFKAREDF